MEKLIEVLKQAKPETDIGDILAAKNLYGQGILDSLDILVIMDEINATFGIAIGGADVRREDFMTVGSLYCLVQRHKGSSGLATAMAQCQPVMAYGVPENVLSVNAVVLHAPVYCSTLSNKEDGVFLAQKLAASGVHFYLTPRPDASQWYARHYPDLYTTHGPELEKTYAMLADEASRRDFTAVVQALVTGELGYLAAAPYQQYEHPVVHVRPGDYVIDGGMYSLADTRRFANRAGSEGRIFGFEPEPEQFAHIQKELAESGPDFRIKAYPFGLGAEIGVCNIVSNGAGSWLTTKNNPAATPCRIVDLDSFVKEHELPRVDVIKLDIEGCEKDALLGAAETMRKFKPRLMIAAYHKKEDLYTLPQTIRAICPEYKLYFTSHYMITGEYLFYASPGESDAL